MGRRALILTVLGAVLLGGLGAIGWWVNHRERSRYTDGDRISTPLVGAPARTVLWQPAELLRGAGAESADQYEPRVSADGQVLVIVRGRAGANADLYQCRREGEGWSSPEPLTGVNTEHDELGPELARDGQALYFYSDRPGGAGGYDLWVSRREGGEWKEAVNLGAAVNTPFNEYGPALTPDGTRLYLSSNRPRPGEERAQRDPWPATIREQRTRHDYDMYVSELGPSGMGAAEAVAEVNTTADEGAPAVSPSGDFLYFASDRTGTLGGFDVFRSRILRGRLLAPENLGAAINTAANDLDPTLSAAGFRLYFSSDRPVGGGGREAGERDRSEPSVYALYASESREVLIETEAMRAGEALARLCGAAWPWVLALLMAALLGIAFYLAMRDAAIRHRLLQLSLMAKCLLISMLIHAALLSAFAAWRVGTAIGEMLGGGEGMRVVLGSAGGGDGPGDVGSQVRGAITSVAIEAPVIETAPAEAAAFEVRAPMVQVAATPANLMVRLAPTEVAHRESTTPNATPAAAVNEVEGSAVAVRSPELVPAASASEEAVGMVAGAELSSRAAAEFGGVSAERVDVAPRAAATERPAAMREWDFGPAGGAGISAPQREEVPRVEAGRVAGQALGRVPAAESGVSGGEVSGVDAVAPVAVGGRASTVRGAIDAGLVRVDTLPAPVPRAPAGSVGVEVGEASAGSMAAPPSGGVLAELRAETGTGVAARLPGKATAENERGSVGERQGEIAAVPILGGAAGRPVVGAMAESRAGSVSVAPEAAGVSELRPGASGSLVIAPVEAAADGGVSAPSRAAAVGGLPALGLRTNLPAVAAEAPVAPAETFAQRSPEVRERVLQQTGGSPETERAVAAALEWFARHQSEDGRWSGREFDRGCTQCSAPAEIEADAAMTGMVLLCYLGAGHTHVAEGAHQERVRRALAWIVNRVEPSGDLRRGETMYSQTIAAVALCEAFAMTRDAWLEGPARRAVTFVARGASRGSAGGSGRGAASDTSVLGWQIMAIKSAQRAGFEVPTTAFDAARRWLDETAARGAPGRYGYRPGEAPSPAATAEAMFVQQLLGRTRDEARMKQSAEFILTAPPAWRREAPTYYWYYATLALFQQQGEHWARWNEAVARELLKNQRREGGARGSWDPQDEWSRLGGRVYQTAVCTLSLEVYYRYRLAEPGGR